MYLIGFLGSPLPYIVLFGLYLSGFALFNWRADGHLAEEDIPEASTIAMDAYGHAAGRAGTASVFSFVHHQQLQHEKPERGGTQLYGLSASSCWQPVYIPVSEHKPVCLYEARLPTAFHLSQHTIRPPPLG